jgi:uncharacterized protein YchJ
MSLSASAPQTLTPVQAQVASLLAAGSTITDAATQASISRQTIYTWLQSNAAFEAAVTQAQSEYETTFHDQLRRLSQLALDSLERILNDEKAPAGVRLRAALAVLKRPAASKPSAWNLPIAEPFAPAHWTESDTNSQPPSNQTPRSAPCPCGSGEKYKRCCGRNAPPVLHASAA